MPFIEQFLARRENPIDTGSVHGPLSLEFRLTGTPEPKRFLVRIDGGRAFTEAEPSDGAAVVVECPAHEFQDVAEGRAELFGPFWSKYLPADFTWAPGLAAYMFPDHPYRGLNTVIDEIYTTPSNYPTITPFPQAYRLYDLVLAERLNLTFEIGLAFGASALLIAEAHKRKGAGHHFAVDPFQTGSFFKGKGLDNIRRSGLQPYISWLHTRARPALSGLKAAGFKFDLIYIDGDHSLPAVLSDFSQADATLGVGGYLAFDDSHVDSGVTVLSLIRSHFDYEDVSDVSTDRFTLLQKRSETRGPIPIRAAASIARGVVPTLEWGRNTLRTFRRQPHH